MSTRITGIGGIFFRSKHPESLSAWYEKHFGINSMGSGYIWDQEAGPTVFSPFAENTDYFGNNRQQFMLNFRVRDLEGLLAELKTENVMIDEKRTDEGYGKFAWVFDPEGNRIELWEPVETTEK
jgi:glyoxylase I family protein